MSMNFIDAARVLADSAELLLRDLLAYEAKSTVQAMIAAYDALAPDWSQAPKWAQWYTIDADRSVHFHEAEPALTISFWESGTDLMVKVVDIPIGLDWRLCKWQRPEVAA